MWSFGKKHNKAPQSDNELTVPVDVNKPVENPQLAAAVSAHSQSPSSATLQELLHELNRAIYLIPFLDDELKTTPGGSDGQVTVERDSYLKILICSDADGHSLLPLFTDWGEIRSWTDEPVSTLVMPASEAWDFVLDAYQGAVINPAGEALPLNAQQVQEIKNALSEDA